MSNIRRGVHCTSANGHRAQQLKNQNAITLVALVITIIVLLILAGITLRLVLGEEGITKRAVNSGKIHNLTGAKEKLELDVANYASDFYQAKYVNMEIGAIQIQEYIMGKFTDGPYEENFTIEKIDTDKIKLTSNTTTDQITTDTATITPEGKVIWGGVITKINGLALSSSLEIKEGQTKALTVTKSGDAAGKSVTWSKSGNVSFVTSLTDATPVASPTTDTVYVKAGALSGGTTGSVTVSATDEEAQTCNITIVETVSSVTISPAAITLGTGETSSTTLSAVAYDTSGNPTDATITYTASPSGKITINNSTGSITAGDEEATVTVTATATQGSTSVTSTTSCTVTIEEPVALLKDQTRGTVLSSTKNTKLKDNKGNKIIIPANFMISNDNANNGDAGNNVEEGIIIEDASGNQFVWIPVGTITRSSGSTTTIGLSRYEFASDGTATAKNPSDTIDSYYTETTSNTVARKDTSGNIEFVEKSKVGAAGGYYIGRYETGTGNVSKYNVAAFKNRTRDQAKTYAQSMYASNTTLYKSDLMNSYAWDTAIYFIQQCGTASNHSTYSRTIGKSTTSAQANTGINLLNATNAVDEQCHIFDMAGNVWEWTTEYSSSSSIPCVLRGGNCYDSTGYTAYRSHRTTGFGYDSVGFRALLYVM